MSDKADAKRSSEPTDDLLGGFRDARLQGKAAADRAGAQVGTTADSRSPTGQTIPSKAGHRQRLRQRFTKGGPGAVHDY